ncbi:MAG TPA: undecaprenyldiphospho-muramoylpentapeptide beta-N-acetylglucosaminyltransferase [Thermomicrobiales bacterium]|nr:undecaprenyldiphospho-muramoylpentapeptide beta-N-acetylglucosaminyltransferase [Thermomicrobiales bacterium]
MSESTTGNAPRPFRVVVAGGGSGGHVTPAVAVIEALRCRVELQALWIGAKADYEGAAAKELGIEFRAVRAGKLRRYPSFATLGDSFRIPAGVVQALRILRTFRPDAIFSTGGFVSVPTVIAGALLRIPSLTHEQTAHIGLATRINARFCNVVALSYESSRHALRTTARRVVVTGNPVRRFVTEGDAGRALARFQLDGGLPLVYVTGGAQGARSINAAILGVLPDLLAHAEVIHQCGPRSVHDDFDRLRSAASELPPPLRERYHVRERVGRELGDVYAAASLVIGRAGAGTVAELSTVGVPSILIPLPGAKEQRQNALHLVEAGAAYMIEQRDLSPEALLSIARQLLENPEEQSRMRHAASMRTHRDAAARLVDELLALVDGPVS